MTIPPNLRILSADITNRDLDKRFLPEHKSKAMELASELLEIYGKFEQIEDYEMCGHVWYTYTKICEKYKLTSEEVFRWYTERIKFEEEKN